MDDLDRLARRVADVLPENFPEHGKKCLPLLLSGHKLRSSFPGETYISRGITLGAGVMSSTFSFVANSTKRSSIVNYSRIKREFARRKSVFIDESGINEEFEDLRFSPANEVLS
jgi:hypothetical protein